MHWSQIVHPNLLESEPVRAHHNQFSIALTCIFLLSDGYEVIYTHGFISIVGEASPLECQGK